MADSGVLSRSLDDELGAILASDPEAMRDPFPAWRRLRDAEPVRELGPRLLVSRHADVKALIRDKNGLSSRAFIDGSQAEAIMAGLTEEQRRAHLEISDFESNYVSRSDGDQHTRLRKIAHLSFTPRRVAEMEATVTRYAEERLERMAEAGEADFMSGLAYDLPLIVITDMLGVPESDRELIHEWSGRLARNRGGDDPEALMAAHSALSEFRAYIGELLDARGDAPPETDLLSALMQAHEGESLDRDELAAMFIILLFAGHETTTNLLGNGLLELHRHPDQWRLLTERPERARAGVEELLRFVSPVQWLLRVAREPMDVAGRQVEPGQTVLLVIAAANRDPDVFADPESLDLLREDAGGHIALGFGPHFCLGNALARLEGAVTLRLLAERYPKARVDVEDVTWRGNAKLRGIERLGVRLAG